MGCVPIYSRHKQENVRTIYRLYHFGVTQEETEFESHRLQTRVQEDK